MRQPTAIVVDFIQFVIGLVGDILFDWILRRKRDQE
jgi:hypothetical protein